MNYHAIKDIGADVVVCARLALTFLPPWEAFADYPRTQRFYKLCIYIVGWIALSQRSRVYKSISTQDGTQLSTASQKPGSQAGGQNQP